MRPRTPSPVMCYMCGLDRGRPPHHDHEQERSVQPSRPLPSGPATHASLVADLFDRARGEQATPGHDLQVGRVGQRLAHDGIQDRRETAEIGRAEFE